jgi:hypothetical protein
VGRKRIHFDPAGLLPPGLYRSGKRFRGREPLTGKWVYFDGPITSAVVEFKIWKFGTLHDFCNETTARTLFRQVRKNAAPRKLAVEITEADVLQLLERSGNLCEVSGIPFDDIRREGMRIRPWIPSIDRIDASKPYTIDNCRVVCAYVNVLLNQFGEGTLTMVADAIVAKRSGGSSTFPTPPPGSVRKSVKLKEGRGPKNGSVTD